MQSKNEVFHGLFEKIHRLHQKFGVNIDACNHELPKVHLAISNKVQNEKNNNQIDLKVTFGVSEVTK